MYIVCSRKITYNGIPKLTKEGRVVRRTRTASGAAQMAKNGKPAKKKVIRPELDELFSAAFNINPDPVALSDSATAQRVLVNPAFENWSGYSREELIGATVGMDVEWYLTIGTSQFWLHPKSTYTVEFPF